MKKLILPVIISLLLFNCSNDEEPSVQAPEITYASTEVSTELFSEGSTDVPTIAWNGDVGSLSLSKSVPGLSINSDDGVISWTKDLPLDTTNFSVIAINSVGQASADIEIVNQFSGSFDGGYNSDPSSTTTTRTNYNLTFNADGTMTVNDSGSTGSGTWSKEGNVITSTYNYEGGDPLSIKADLDIQATKAVLTGFWYNGSTTNDGEEDGYIELEYLTGS